MRAEGDSKAFDVKVRLRQETVLSPAQSVIAMKINTKDL